MQNLPMELREKILLAYADDRDTKKVLRQVCKYFQQILPLERACCIIVGMIAWAINEFVSSDARYVEINNVIIQTDDDDDLKAVIRDALTSGDKVTIEFNVRHVQIGEFFAMSDRCKELFFDATYAMGKAFPGSALTGSVEVNEPIILRSGYDFDRCLEISIFDAQIGAVWLDEFVLKFE